MPQHPQRIWLVAFVVAWTVDFLFWNKPIGISLLLFILLALAGGYGLARSEKVQPARFSYVLSGLVALMAAVTILRSEPFTRVLNSLLALAGLMLLVMTFRSGSWVRFRILDYIIASFELFVVTFFRAAGLRLAPQDEAGSRGMLRRTVPVVRGFLLAAPVVLVLGALPASADLVFADQLNTLFANFDLENIPQYIFRLFYILVLSYVFTGYYLQAIFPTRWGTNKPKDPEGDAQPGVEPAAEDGPLAPTVARFLGSIEAFIVLGSVNLLFAFFVAVQFQYFFGGRENITAAGYTFSEYARRGFFELVWVAVISLLLFLVLNAVTARTTPAKQRIFTGLSILLVLLVLVILISAFSRLLLYEGAYGFTSLRTYTHIFIPWLGFLLLATIILEILRCGQYFGALLLLTTFGFALTFGVMNIDGFIVRQNVARARAGMELDGSYLLSLSDDAVPALAQEYQRADQPQPIRDQLGAVLSCQAYNQSIEEPQPWQAYHPSSAAARRMLAQLDLKAYPVRMQGGQPYAVHGTQSFSCTRASNMD